MKNFLIRVLPFFFHLVTSTVISGQEFTYSLFDTKDGLPSSAITALAEDHYGHLWIGTDGGLARYNGYEFQYFFNEPTYRPGRVNALDVDNWGNIWIGTNTGLSRFSQGEFHPVELAGLDTISIQGLIATERGQVIIATIYDLYILDGIEEGELTFDHFERDGILYLEENYNGEIWIGTTNDLQKFSKGNIIEEISQNLTNSEGVINVYPLNDKLLIATEDDNIYLFDPELRKLETKLPYQEGFGDFVCFKKWNGQIWSIYSFLILQQSDSIGTQISYPKNWNIKSIKTCLVDSNENLWLGSSEGLIRIRKSSFTDLDFSDIKYEIYSMMEDREQVIWMGSNHGLVYQWDQSGIQRWKTPPDFSGEVIDMVQDTGGNIWLASYWLGLVHVTEDSIYRFQVEDISELGPDIYDLQLDSNNNLWIGSYRGVFIKKENENKFIAGDSLGLPNQCDVYEIKVGAKGVWLATSCGLYHEKGQRLEHINLPDLSSVVSIRSLLVDDSLLWIGTVGFGLRCYRIEKNNLDILYVVDQPDRTILDIEKGKDRIWAGTPRILLEIYPDSNFHLNIFSATDGFFNEGYAFLKLFVDHHKNLYITTSRGLKKLVRENTGAIIERNIVLNHLLADGKDVDLTSTIVSLPSKTKIIEFSYYYPDITRTDFLYYQWKMLDQEEWTDWSSRREISLYNPRSGPYQLEIRVKEANQILNSKKINFLVSYAWYQQSWIQAGILLGVGFMLYSFLKKRETTIRLKQHLETERALTMASLESRALRAQMNPHFLFNILNNLQEMILAGESSLAQSYLTKFSRLMRMILNISSKEYIKLENELEFLNLYLELEQLRFDHQLKISIETDPELLVEEIPVFMIQPLIENAIRHGLRPLQEEKKLQIIIDQYDSSIRIQVIDNGVGLKERSRFNIVEEKTEVRALDLIRQRLDIIAEKSDVECSFRLEPNKNSSGTKSQLILPIQKI